MCETGIQLKWEQEFSNRGLAFGRQGRWTKGGNDARSPAAQAASPRFCEAEPLGAVRWCRFPLVQSHHFVNSFYYDYDLDNCEEGPAQEGPSEEGPSDALVASSSSPSWSSSLSSIDTLMLRDPRDSTSSTSTVMSRAAASGFSRFPWSFAERTGIDVSLLEYYLLRLCPLTTPSRTSSSPFSRLIIPLFSFPDHEDIRKAVMALSARHRSTTDSQWYKTAMTLKGAVIASLRQRLLAASTGSGGVVWDPQILIVMMFLCLYEIVDNCDHRWVIHLQASQDIIRRSRQIEPSRVYRDLGELTTFTERFFAYQDVISRTACGNSPLFGIEYWDSANQPADVDSWMGCSPALVKILCRITELSRMKSSAQIEAREFEQQSADLEHELDMMQRPAIPPGDTLASSAELKRKSVLLYHHCVLYDAGPSTTFVSTSVSDILKEIRDLARAGAVAGLAFPIFVAAVELSAFDDVIFCDDESGQPVHGRRLVLEMLEEVGRSSLSNISRTRAVIQKVWRARDMSLDEDTAGGSKTRSNELNDWSLFVGPYSSNISLA